MSKPESALWDRIGHILTERGFALFDLEEPRENRKGQLLRVYITRANGDPGVTLDDCALVNRAIWEADEVDSLLPEECLIEVSSPGVERRLRRPEHFIGALGETVRLKVKRADGSSEILKGKLITCEGGTVTLARSNLSDRDHLSEAKLQLAEVADARILFSFGERSA